EFAASTGEQVRFNADGTALGIERTDGNISTLGAQWSSSRWLAGANLIASRDTTEADVALARADALHSYVGWRSGDLQAQAQLIQSKTSASGRANGLWADMQTRTGPVQHEWGVFRFEPGVAWGPLAMVSDLQGAHYRASYRSRQWLWDANAEVFKPLSGAFTTGQYFALNGRYQMSRDLGVGASAAVRRQGQNAHAVSAYVDSINTLGNTRVQWDRQEDLAAQTTDRIVLDQAWAIPAGWRASTSLGFESVRGGASNRALLAGALLGADPRPNLTVDLNLRTRRVLDNTGEDSLDASLSARLQLSSNWLVSLSYSESRGEFAQLLTLDPLIIGPVITTTTSNKSLFIALRYQDQAGRAMAPLGGRPGDAAGSIRGVVYLDANDNGKRDAGEAAAANVTVVLDGRFAARTDAQGWFEFPLVTAGSHKLTVVQDNLPLPWFAPESAINADVSTRSVTQIDIGAKRGN
ncbi:MAG: carboxypeptidase-like regulatory domain-containing protein, partial [Burkholderiaceae bacterium]